MDNEIQRYDGCYNYQLSIVNYSLIEGLRGARNNGQSAVHGNPGRYERSRPFFQLIIDNEQ